MKRTLTSILLLSIILSSTIFVSTTLGAPPDKVPVIVGFKELPDSALIHAFGGEITYQYSIISAIACSLPPQAIAALQNNPKIAYIEEDQPIYASDLELDHSWGVKRIGAGIVHQSGNKGSGVNIAVLDTGINNLHEELLSAYKGGFNVFTGTEDPWDDNGHGTHCAGIIAAADNDNDVVVGVAPEVNLYSVKVLDSAGGGTSSTVIAGIEWAMDNGINIISMSLGSTASDVSLQQACNTAYNAGILIVAASGNNYRSTVSYPAAYESVIAVGATDNRDRRATFSNYGSALELMAPGVNILSTYIDVSPNDNRNIDTWTMSGTSMACPHVAGTAALIFASPVDTSYDADHDEVWDAAEVRTKLKDTADNLGTLGWDKYYGYGLVDADEAAALPPPDITPPSITDIEPANNAIVRVSNPTISAKISDSSGINPSSIIMKLDGASLDHNYDDVTGIVTASTIDLSTNPHTVLLSVADFKGNLATQEWVFTVDTSSLKTIHVQITDLTLKTAGLNTYAVATIQIMDSNDAALSGVTVTGQWSGATTDKDTGVTNSEGIVVFQSDNVKRAKTGQTFTITVEAAILDGYVFEGQVSASKTK